MSEYYTYAYLKEGENLLIRVISSNGTRFWTVCRKIFDIKNKGT